MAIRERKHTFDEIAEAYDRARPGYPTAAFDDIAHLADLTPGARILEIGCGTGQSTVEWARRGYAVTCIELGAALAEVARRNLAPYSAVDVRVGSFEGADLPDGAFDLVFASQAWHWLDSEISYGKAARILRPGGSLGLLWNIPVDPHTSDGFFARSMPIYRRHAPDLASEDGSETAVQRRDRYVEGIAASGCFGPVQVRRHPWQRDYTAAEYVALIDTYSDHRLLADPARAALYADLRALIDSEFGGRITKTDEATLFVARATV